MSIVGPLVGLTALGSLAGIVSIVVVSVTLSNVISNGNQLEQLVSPPNQAVGDSCLTQPGSSQRRQKAYQLRIGAAFNNYADPIPCQTPNGDDTRYIGTHLASFSKGLPHDSNGFVDQVAYADLSRAVASGSPSDYDNVPLGSGAVRKLDNPQAGQAFTLLGGDSRSYAQPPAPRFDSAEQAGEYAENAWMALTRDVPFRDYGTNPTIAQAAVDLAAKSVFHGPTVAAKLFRGPYTGCDKGPFISQFMFAPGFYGANVMESKLFPPLPGRDFMTNMSEYLNVQNGQAPSYGLSFGPSRLYIRTGRDLAHWVHMDVLYQGYTQALQVLIDYEYPMKPGIPYVTSPVNQRAFGTWGLPFIASIIPTVAHIALETVWYQKWSVHKRIRPEVYGQRVHLHKTGTYPIAPNGPHTDILTSTVLAELAAYNAGALRNNGAGGISYLLPQAFPEGSPVHPSYGAGHATVAGACVTILKAFFVEETEFGGSAVEPTGDGMSFIVYSGDTLTVLGELNKLAWNIAGGRNIAGKRPRRYIFSITLFPIRCSLEIRCNCFIGTWRTSSHSFSQGSV